MDDNDLVAAVARGDDVALRELLARHARWLAARLRAALPAGDVEDVLQESFLAVWRGAGAHRPVQEDGAAAWLWGIARRQAALFLRRRGPLLPGPSRLDQMTPEELVGLAIDVADEGLAAGEMPVGAVVVMGDEIIGRAYTQEKVQGRRLVHADLLAMQQADQRLGWMRRTEPLYLAVNLEPCLMCLGAAMSLVVTSIYYGLEAPGDGAAGIASVWQPARPDMPFSRVPPLTGGIRRVECRAQFARYASTAPNSGRRSWAQSLADLPA